MELGFDVMGRAGIEEHLYIFELFQVSLQDCLGYLMYHKSYKSSSFFQRAADFKAIDVLSCIAFIFHQTGTFSYYSFVCFNTI